MPKVPERQLSYGELLENLKRAHKYKTRKQELKKYKKPKVRKNQKIQRHEYSYGEVMARINRIMKDD